MFGTKRGKDNGAALFHIGSGSVGIAYTDLGKEKPTVHYAKRRFFEEREKPSVDRYLSRVLWAATSAATEMAMNKEFSSFKEVHCFIPSLLTYREVRKIHYKGASFKVTHDLVANLVKKEIETLAGEDPAKKDKVLLEQKILDIQLNGYSIADPYNKQADSMMVTLFVSYTEKVIVEKLKNIVHQVFHTDNTLFHGTPLSLYATVGMLFPKEENFTLLNVSSEVSDLIVSVDNDLTQIISFPFGRNTFLRLLAREMGVEMSEAHSILGLYKSEKLNEKSRTRTEGALAVIQGMWKESFKRTIEEGKLRGGLPARILIVSDPSVSSFFPEWFKESRRELFSTEDSENFSIKELDTAVFSKKIDNAHKESLDPMLILLSLFTNGLK
ncbi:hypothetical protein CL654_02270 [bacterium]|nr:hypothetical protein [bacterium]|tara:strand:+ start:6122 stop:7273 length:1152 start_codon:yes stop_codon:yes gene_type:complete